MKKRELNIMVAAFAIGLVAAIAPTIAIIRTFDAIHSGAGATGPTGVDASATPSGPSASAPDVGVDPDGTATPRPTPAGNILPGNQGSEVGSAKGGANPAPVQCPTATRTVSSSKELFSALADAQAGDVIVMADGTYSGAFTAAVSGTSSKPIYLCGSENAVLDGGGFSGGYVVHLDGAQYWRLMGFTVQNGQKGVVADGTVGSLMQGLTIRAIGDEALHLRRNSTDNTVSGNSISDTGHRREKFGEGIYIGTAESNWCDVTDCQPDRSDRNLIENNRIHDVTAEAIDIKEGTTGGTVRSNTFDGSGLTKDGADSWVDVKGNNWMIENNTGANSSMDGFQVHQILDGWGKGNRFRGNTAKVNGPGFGFSLTPAQDNVVECSNVVSQAKEGYANVSCS